MSEEITVESEIVEEAVEDSEPVAPKKEVYIIKFVKYTCPNCDYSDTILDDVPNCPKCERPIIKE